MEEGCFHYELMAFCQLDDFAQELLDGVAVAGSYLTYFEGVFLNKGRGTPAVCLHLLLINKNVSIDLILGVSMTLK